jgi:hypothetical protein
MGAFFHAATKSRLGQATSGGDDGGGVGVVVRRLLPAR